MTPFQKMLSTKSAFRTFFRKQVFCQDIKYCEKKNPLIGIQRMNDLFFIIYVLFDSFYITIVLHMVFFVLLTSKLSTCDIGKVFQSDCSLFA